MMQFGESSFARVNKPSATTTTNTNTNTNNPLTHNNNNNYTTIAADSAEDDPMDTEPFENLYEESKRLVVGSDFGSSVVQHRLDALERGISRNLASVLQQSQMLKEKNKRIAEVGPKSDYLLSQKGFNVERYKNSLLAIKPSTHVEPSMDMLDMETYLRRQQSLVILQTIEDAKKATSNRFYANYEQFVKRDWEENVRKRVENQVFMPTREELMLPMSASHMFTPVKGDVMSSPLTTTSTDHQSVFASGYSASGTTPYTLSTPSLLPVEKRYETRGKMTGRVAQYAQVLNQWMMTTTTTLNQSFDLIQQFKQQTEIISDVQEKSEVIECWNLLRYLVEDRNRGAIKALANQYLTLVKTIVKNHYATSRKESIRENKLYMVSDNMREVERYVEILVENDKSYSETSERFQISNGKFLPLWALVYYCIRCGLRDDALAILKRCGHEGRPVLTRLISGQAEQISHETIDKESKQLPTDKYLNALYLVLGKLSPDKNHADIFTTTEDWIWYKLNVKNISDLQSLILNFGPDHFCRGANVMRYFKLLLLTQQFSEAIKYLFNQNGGQFAIEAVHFAIAINYYHLEQPQKLQFANIINDYVRMLSQCDVRSAISYLLLLREDEQFEKYLISFVFEIDDVALLFGTSDASRAGLLAILPDQILRSLIKKVAEEYKNKARYKEAINLYYIAYFKGEHCQKAIVESATKFLRDSLLQEAPTNDALAAASTILSSKDSEFIGETDTLRLLINIAKFFAQPSKETLKQYMSDILPLRGDIDKCTEIANVHEDVKQLYSRILLLAGQILADDRQAIQNLFNFAGRINQYISIDCSRYLFQLNSQLNQ